MSFDTIASSISLVGDTREAASADRIVAAIKGALRAND
jgi:hypothetical protein